MAADLSELAVVAAQAGDWRDSVETGGVTVTAAPLIELAALLAGPAPGNVVPPMWHPVVCSIWSSYDALGDDGHPRTGVGFPPMPDRRRLFGGGSVILAGPLVVGDDLTWQRRVVDVRHRLGSSGELLLVTVELRCLNAQGVVVLTDAQDLIYRQPTPGAGPAKAADPALSPALAAPGRVSSLDVATDPLRLFRFSVLTHNSHRIHYDEQYAVDVEGLPGRLVHGPYLAAAMLEVVRRAEPDATVTSVVYRALRPAIAGVNLSAYAISHADGRWQLAVDSAGTTVMTGTVETEGNRTR